MFDHERLEVYQRAVEVVAWAGELLDADLARRGQSAVKQLDRASTSVPLNIAEGNGKRSSADRARYLDIARGSALESAACLDVLVARKLLQTDRVLAGKSLLTRIVEMLSKLVARFAEEPSTSTSTSTRCRQRGGPRFR